MKPSKPYIIGLTGGIASGKSTLARALRGAGAQVIDADEISRSLTAPGGAALPAIRQAFGDAVFTGDELNRRALGALVFSNKQALDTLNRLTHPLIEQEMLRQMDALGDEPALVLDVPLLFEAGWNKYCDEVWCACVPAWVQVSRIMKRDKLPLSQAWQRVRSQMPGYRRRRLSDHVVYTSGTKEQSAAQVLKLWQNALRRNAHGL